MVVGVMQPYFFPYIGYFQLMAACDLFVFLDDVQYIQRGWVNRNRILVNGRAQWLTLPVARADHRLAINQRLYLLDDRLARSARRRIIGAYRGAPFFEPTLALVDEALACELDNVAAFNATLLQRVTRALGIETPVRLASSIPKAPWLTGQNMVIEICAQVGAVGYLNPIGGIGLYDPKRFEERRLTLRFLESGAAPYDQFGSRQVPFLSVIDVMMFNNLDAIHEMLRAYRLISGRSDMNGSANATGGNES